MLNEIFPTPQTGTESGDRTATSNSHKQRAQSTDLSCWRANTDKRQVCNLRSSTSNAAYAQRERGSRKKRCRMVAIGSTDTSFHRVTSFPHALHLSGTSVCGCQQPLTAESDINVVVVLSSIREAAAPSRHTACHRPRPCAGANESGSSSQCTPCRHPKPARLMLG